MKSYYKIEHIIDIHNAHYSVKYRIKLLKTMILMIILIILVNNSFTFVINNQILEITTHFSTTTNIEHVLDTLHNQNISSVKEIGDDSGIHNADVQHTEIPDKEKSFNNYTDFILIGVACLVSCYIIIIYWDDIKDLFFDDITDIND